MYAQLSLIVISLHLLFILPKYHAQFDRENFYSECNKTFNCGKNVIGYPFWGGYLPEYCGRGGLKLSCEVEDDEKSATMLNMSPDKKFRVQYINMDTHEIKIERTDDVWQNDCPQEFDYETLFDYGHDTKDLQVFYNCPTAPAVLNNFRCTMSPGYETVAFFGDESLLSQFPNLTNCSMKVRFPVNGTVLEELKSNVKMELQELLNPSFVVFYKTNEVKCSACKNSGGLCWPDNKNSGDGFLCVCRDWAYPHPCPKASGSKKNSPLKIGIGIGAAASAMLLLLFVYCLRRYLSNNLGAFGKTKSDKEVEAFIRQYGFSTPKRYKYSTLKSITNSVKHELGKGGYGNVYKGKLPDGRVVAVKVLNVSKGKGEEFINEVASIGRTSHVNVVTLLGFCYEGKRRALIYEFMPNGSLEKFIYGKISPMGGQHLGCEKLYNIALGITRGLEYLHQGCNTRIVHFDIKPHNILLDKDFCPKISDFGLAKLYTRKDSIISMMEARGTIGYIAPEVFSRNFGQVSHKSDVYSYGMMILEMVGGRKNVDAGAIHTSEIYFPHWIYKHIELNEELNLVSAMTIEENEIATKMIIVGLWCIQTDPSQRPSISKVIEMLEGSIAALEIPPNLYLCSPRARSNS